MMDQVARETYLHSQHLQGLALLEASNFMQQPGNLLRLAVLCNWEAEVLRSEGCPMGGSAGVCADSHRHSDHQVLIFSWLARGSHPGALHQEGLYRVSCVALQAVTFSIAVRRARDVLNKSIKILALFIPPRSCSKLGSISQACAELQVVSGSVDKVTDCGKASVGLMNSGHRAESPGLAAHSLGSGFGTVVLPF